MGRRVPSRRNRALRDGFRSETGRSERSRRFCLPREYTHRRSSNGRDSTERIALEGRACQSAMRHFSSPLPYILAASYHMPRGPRCLLPGVPCHITQRGVDRREAFSSGEDRHTYLGLLRQILEDTNVRILAYCLMSNHIHLIAVPGRPDSMSVPMRRVHGRYAQYYNAHTGRAGHLWQNRFFGCMLAASHLGSALALWNRTRCEREWLAARRSMSGPARLRM